MKIGVLKAGRPAQDIAATGVSYSGLIAALLGSDFDYLEFDVRKDGPPDFTSAAGGYVITGSSSSAYDDDIWIMRLKNWLRGLNPDIPLIGICFGHQIMAQTYGGVVEKSNNGLGVGLHEYVVRTSEPWMDGAGTFVIPASHYDQVVVRPPSAQVIAASDFCPYAALSYTDRRAISFQGHPEAPLDLTAQAIERWQGQGLIGPEEADRARASMQLHDDRARIGCWIRRFLHMSKTSRESTAAP